MLNITTVTLTPQEITAKLTEMLKSFPKNQTCTDSNFPKKMWCGQLRKPAYISVCEQCPHYDPKYIIKN